MKRNTYSASTRSTSPAGPVVIFLFQNPAASGRKIIISRLLIDPTAGGILMRVIKRSTLTTGGTLALATTVPHNSRAPAGVGFANFVTSAVGLVLGTIVGNVRAYTVGEDAKMLFDQEQNQGIVLHPTQEITIHNDTAAATPEVSVSFQWQEY